MCVPVSICLHVCAAWVSLLVFCLFVFFVYMFVHVCLHVDRMGGFDACPLKNNEIHSATLTDVRQKSKKISSVFVIS